MEVKVTYQDCSPWTGSICKVTGLTEGNISIMRISDRSNETGNISEQWLEPFKPQNRLEDFPFEEVEPE
jgi:hypothetical protein